MKSLIHTIAERQRELAERGVHLAARTRERGVEALGRVRDGTLDWHRTIAARRRTIGAKEARAGWPRLDGLQVFVLDRVDRLLAAFAERVRAEIERLGRLELGRSPASSGARGTREGAEEGPKPAKKGPRAEAHGPKKARAGSKGKKAARARKGEKAAAAPRSRPSRRLVMPIADYDTLTAKEVIAELRALSPAQCEVVRAHEASHKKRKTVLAALEARLA